MDLQNTLYSPDAGISQVPSQEKLMTQNVRAFLKKRSEHARKFYTGEASTIKVSEVLGSIAYLYERIRNIVEYKNEQVLRRSGIERMVKRLMWERSSRDTTKLAQILLRELIWARYLPNDRIPKRKIAEVASILNKYLYLVGVVTEKGSGVPVAELRSWIWGVASCEIEEVLDPITREPYVELMYNWFITQFAWHNDDLSDHEKSIQMYLAVHRALTKSDEHIMRYHLLLREFPAWRNADEAMVAVFAEKFWHLYQEVEKHLQFPDRFALYRTMQKQIAPFEILKELIVREKDSAETILKDPAATEQKVREICQIRYAQIQTKVRRGTVRSIIYIFITKVVFALLIEIPYDIMVIGNLEYLPLAINVVVPPTLMFLIGLTIKAPNETNTARILTILKTIVYESPVQNKTLFSLAKVRRGNLLGNTFALVYLALFILVFGGITWLLIQLHFSLVGILVFFAFLSLVLLFGFRVRFTASELKITGNGESFFGYIFNNLTLPFLSTGVYLSKGLAKINFLTLILDFLIEAPLKTIIEVIEEWTSFIREKREEVVEVPQQ